MCWICSVLFLLLLYCLTGNLRKSHYFYCPYRTIYTKQLALNRETQLTFIASDCSSFYEAVHYKLRISTELYTILCFVASSDQMRTLKLNSLVRIRCDYHVEIGEHIPIRVYFRGKVEFSTNFPGVDFKICLYVSLLGESLWINYITNSRTSTYIRNAPEKC